MNREQLGLSLLLSVPPGVGVVMAIRLSAPNRLSWLVAVLGGFVTTVVIFGLLYLAVNYNPPLPDGDDPSADE